MTVRLPARVDFLIAGAGIHGLATARALAARGAGSVLVVDKTGVGAGASGIACGVVRNNYYQPAMRELMAHSVAAWERDAQTLSYHPVGYLQISPDAMAESTAQIYAEQKAIGYESELIEGGRDCDSHMKSLFHDWRASGVCAILHEKRGGYANNQKSMQGLAAMARAAGAQIAAGVTITAIERESGSDAARAVITDCGRIECGQLIIAAGPWVKSFWDMLDLPAAVSLNGASAPMWRYWALEEGVLEVPPDFLQTDAGEMPPVVHLDSGESLADDDGGDLHNGAMWGIYYKPDFEFNGVQGGGMPREVMRPADEVAVDPYGPESPEFVVGEDFARKWCAGLAFCQGRFAGKRAAFRNEPSGGIGCFTPDSFPVFDRFRENVYIIADSNHGYKMLGVGELAADEVTGGESALLAPFRFARFARGDLHPTSASPFPWS